MADFRRALVATLGHEGHYVDDPIDRGGETYRGITRRDHPDWPGWRVVDEAKREDGFPRNLQGNAEIERLAGELYKRRYWDRFQGDDITDQGIANELFDTGVNAGVGRAVGFLQRALNQLNAGGRWCPDVVEDGDLGVKTLAALRQYLPARGGAQLLKAMNVLQGAFYLELARRDPSQERFVHGWLNRVDITKAAAV